MHRCRSASRRPRRWGGLLVAATLLALPPSATRAQETLYDGLGGSAGLDRIVHGMLQRATADARIGDKFDNIDLAYLERHLSDRLCAWTGGPCPAHGPSMKGVHAELELTDRHFNALVEDLEASMDAAGTPYGVQNRLLALLAPMHRDVVSR